MNRTRAVLLVSAICLGHMVPAGAAVSAPGSPGDQQWASAYNGSGGGNDKAFSTAISPDGTRAFVTGSIYDGALAGYDFATIAYDRSTGAEEWVAVYDGPGSQSYHDDSPRGLVVSPDGSTVVVFGSTFSETGFLDIVTVAYDAQTGEQLWVDPLVKVGSDSPGGIAMSPDGSKVFVAGTPGLHIGYLIVAYDVSSGTRLWESLFKAPRSSPVVVTDVAASPDGNRAYVTGFTFQTGYDMTTATFDATTGAVLWAADYDSSEDDIPRAIAANPDGSSVVVTGYSGKGLDFDMATVALDADTGSQLWASTFSGPLGHFDQAVDVAMSPSGRRVFVTGWFDWFQGLADYGTVAYDAATGTEVWAARYDGEAGGKDIGQAVAVSPDGAWVFVTGASLGQTSQFDYATVAYRSTNGDQSWVSRYDGSSHGSDHPKAIAVTPDGRAVIVTGFSGRAGQGLDFATVSYRA